MPEEIVTETCWVESVEACSAPACGLSEKEVEQYVDEMMNFMEIFKPAFRRMEQLTHSQTYSRGLLGDAPRKNVEQMALGLGEKVRSLQYFVGQSPWAEEPVIAIQQQQVGETLG